MKIDLGMQYEDMEVPMPMSHTKDRPKKHYPSFTFDGPEELGIPKEGTMTVSYKEVRSSNSESGDGKKHYSCTIEIRDILDVEEEKDERPSKSYDDAGAALDKLMHEKMGSKKDY